MEPGCGARGGGVQASHWPTQCSSVLSLAAGVRFKWSRKRDIFPISNKSTQSGATEWINLWLIIQKSKVNSKILLSYSMYYYYLLLLVLKFGMFLFIIFSIFHFCLLVGFKTHHQQCNRQRSSYCKTEFLSFQCGQYVSFAQMYFFWVIEIRDAAPRKFILSPIIMLEGEHA